MKQYGINTCELADFHSPAKMYTHEYKYFHTSSDQNLDTRWHLTVASHPHAPRHQKTFNYNFLSKPKLKTVINSSFLSLLKHQMAFNYSFPSKHQFTHQSRLQYMYTV